MWVVVVREETYFSINYFSTTANVGAFLRCVLGKIEGGSATKNRRKTYSSAAIEILDRQSQL